ncbi:DEAD/DEAH box helicase [Candidatus Venteria ishoeyi]|uniref:ATP-dependent RNA helicase RhlB n=1 Tax=Candidatus Venteria ishoeyi TaxID=1899563 RepID=A0A1H6FIS8_9GAMM|nr:DEAD/DEAH box helicase [Candidatus Venteria ishoeyi]SEH09016.1 ATP-dependent RNA helicase RhlB [Candidatus Venteria ishoeyi]
MKILHAFWQPQETDNFIQPGTFYLWAETSKPCKTHGREANLHPFHVLDKVWPEFLGTLSLPLTAATENPLVSQTIWLPSGKNGPLPSPELSMAEDVFVASAAWRVDCYALEQPVKQFSDFHFLATYQAQDVRLGTDFLFWYWFTQGLKGLLLRDHYIPALRYYKSTSTDKLYAGWQWASSQYEDFIAQAVAMMPPACAASHEQGVAAESLLRHCSAVLLEQIVRQTKIPKTFHKKIQSTLLEDCLIEGPSKHQHSGASLDSYRQWLKWRAQIVTTAQQAAFTLTFQLIDAPPEQVDDWTLNLQAIPKDDPSLRIDLADYWAMSKTAKQKIRKQLGKDFEKHLLLNLGQAARMFPKLWQGMDTAEPHSIQLNLDEAFAFLKESAWILEDAGFKIIVPSWWTPQGRRRVKVRLRASGSKKATAAGANKSHFNLKNIINYSYQLAIGDDAMNEVEWRQLVEAKTPLVHFRGQWVELDRDKMQEMLEFWHKHGDEQPEMSIQELLQKTAEDDLFEVDRNDALAQMLDSLRDQSKLEPITNPPQLKAELRAYQKRGVAWLNYLEQLGLNGCLADDMGLGKTMQVIARLLVEREQDKDTAPTLLIAPTSVIGNWHKEVEKFAPHLRTHIHHGSKREKNARAFQQLAAQQDILITSYTLIRKDEKLFNAADWRRVVLDEAQNIKNPKAAQTKAILKLQTKHRLALTGTPVENRLMDLWSIFNFLNPGYLGTQARFRKDFELPVQRDNDPIKTTTLKHLVEPFILRRLKTDKNIIQDLPDKVEAKQYCNLSKEQASLYEAVVRDVEQQLEEKEGIERQGLMLSTLMKLKQICNHPAQFLQDNSDFTPQRSHKLERLGEMLEETMLEGDSVLIFSQFTEIGKNLEKYLKGFNYPTYYLHGGTTRNKRERMIDEFQDPASPPSIFILSVKAGGVGITLTKANHVFHFDRWWNPAVEDQATDRAFRIGQEKNVFVHKFVTLGTLEERIDQMIEDKKAIAGAVVGNDESWLSKLDNEAFRELIALNKTAVVE